MAKDSQQANMLTGGDKATRARHRASVACCACRERRTRCVVPVGEQQCVQCKDAGQACVIKHDDERRKPNSKAYVNSLRNRIAQLEDLLEDKEPRSESESRQESNYDNAHVSEGFASNTEAFEFAVPQLPEHSISSLGPQEIILDEQSPANSAFSGSSASRSTMSRLLSTKGHLGFDQLSGRLRWFGGTYNIHVLSDLAVEAQENNRQAMEQARRTQRVLSTLSQDTQEYLMDRFFQHYNSVIHIIHEAEFKEGMAAGQGRFYSPFLHIVILAMGFRHAEKNRPDVIRISLPGKESTLHREAKYMLDYELERPGGVTSIQALLLLGDLECGVGRDNLGWLISGMAMRILFDAGLHLANPAGFSQSEIEIGRMTLWACVIYDRYWALFLGRPTALKPDDLEVYRLAQQFERLGTLEPAGPGRSLEKQIYEALLDLMELAGKITEIVDKASRPNARLDQHVYVTASALTHELEIWYARLPRSLQWIAENIEGAPASYFLLHQQYHAAIILLHREFAQYDDIMSMSSDQSSEHEDSQDGSHFATLSRMKCTKSAGRMAQIFWQHRQSYNMKHIFVTGLQHAGTAAIALVAAVASPKDRASRETNMRYLECLTASIEDMTETYQPAERMALVLKVVLEEIKAVHPPTSKTVPLRRGSSADREPERQNSAKRHQRGRPSSKRTNSQIQATAVPFHELQRRHTTTGMPAPDPAVFENANAPNDDTYNFDSTDGISAAAVTEPQMAYETNLFSMCENAFSQEFNRPASPNQLRSAWMGAITPTFSPMPTGSSATTFLNTSAPEFLENVRSTNLNTQQSDIFSGSANLDFMAMLNATDQNQSTGHGANIEAAQGTDHDMHEKQQPLDSLPTPTSQTNSVEDRTMQIDVHRPQSTVSKSPSRSRHRKESQSARTSDPLTKPDTRGYSHTMAGLDDIWKEMMRTNQNSTTVK